MSLNEMAMQNAQSVHKNIRHVVETEMWALMGHGPWEIGKH
jgi:hypothetical protein